MADTSLTLSFTKYFNHAINILLVAVILFVANSLRDLSTGQQLLNQELSDQHGHYVQRQDQINKELDDHETRIRGVEPKTARMP